MLSHSKKYAVQYHALLNGRIDSFQPVLAPRSSVEAAGNGFTRPKCEKARRGKRLGSGRLGLWWILNCVGHGYFFCVAADWKVVRKLPSFWNLGASQPQPFFTSIHAHHLLIKTDGNAVAWDLHLHSMDSSRGTLLNVLTD